jgi:uncharacterized protein (DUF1501 family)
MKRRTFLRKSASFSVGIPLLLNGSGLYAFRDQPLFKTMNRGTDRVLVLIQLNGGNDGLNMILPVDQYQNLIKVRSDIIIPETQALKITEKTGLHPSMTGIKQSFEEGQICIIQNVGYPDQNRSHFRSTDIWHSASSSSQVINSGWLGRYLDNYIPNYPENFPNTEYPDPFALTVGNIISETCQGMNNNYSLATQDPFGLSELFVDDYADTANTAGCYIKELDFIRTTIEQTNAYGKVITEAAKKGSNLAVYPEGNNLAQQLKTIALLISGGLKTRVYVASIGGFDTHANQVEENNPLQGRHANLLAELSEAITTFQKDLGLQGLGERVIGMTYSEFGRRISANGSFGTDHGSAAPMILFGNCVNPTIVGDNPFIPDEVGPQDGVEWQFDFRSVYGSLLHQWFDVPIEQMTNILFDDFSMVPLISGCSGTTGNAGINRISQKHPFTCYPNPFSNLVTAHLFSTGEHLRLSILNSKGAEIKIVYDGYLSEGYHKLSAYTHDLPEGNYLATLRGLTRTETCKIILIR